MSDRVKGKMKVRHRDKKVFRFTKVGVTHLDVPLEVSTLRSKQIPQIPKGRLVKGPIINQCVETVPSTFQLLYVVRDQWVVISPTLR